MSVHLASVESCSNTSQSKSDESPTQPAKKLRSDNKEDGDIVKKEVLPPSAAAAIIQQQEVLSPPKEAPVTAAE